MSAPGYIAYIDEAGDFGLRSVVPVDISGGSEWFVLGAIVVRKENERLVEQWLAEVRKLAKNTQARDLHFRALSGRQKRIVCDHLASLPVRLFVYISNKQNMRQHRNEAASKISRHKHWFYWWGVRLLLERITAFCSAQNAKAGTPKRSLQLEFSRRRDLRKSDFQNYFARLWAQGEKPYLNKRTIDWSVFDFKQVEFYDHHSRPGLQFSDVVASAFFQAVNVHPQGYCDPRFASALKPRMYAPVRRTAMDEGFIVWPHRLDRIHLTEEQKVIFRLFGFPEKFLGMKTKST